MLVNKVYNIGYVFRDTSDPILSKWTVGSTLSVAPVTYTKQQVMESFVQRQQELRPQMEVAANFYIDEISVADLEMYLAKAKETFADLTGSKLKERCNN